MVFVLNSCVRYLTTRLIFPVPLPVAGAARNAAVANVAQGVANGVANSLRANIAADQGLNVAGAANAIAAADRTHVLLTSPGQTSAGFRRLPASGGGGSSEYPFSLVEWWPTRCDNSAGNL